MISFISRPTYRSWSEPRSGSDTVDGVEPLGLLGVVAQLGAKVLHVAVDGALVTLKVVAEHLLDQLHAVVDAAGMTASVVSSLNSEAVRSTSLPSTKTLWPRCQ